MTSMLNIYLFNFILKCKFREQEPKKSANLLIAVLCRFDGFDREMNANASRVAVVNQLARQLLHVDHPNSEEIVSR